MYENHFSFMTRRATKRFFLVFFGAVSLASGITNAAAQKSVEKGICVVTAGTSGSQKYVTLKCHKVSKPGVYSIRSTTWERKDKKGYKNLARFSGKRFRCDMIKGGQRLSGDTVHTKYDLKNCR